MKPPMNESPKPIKCADTPPAKKMDPNAPIRNAGTQRRGGLNEQSNIRNADSPDPKSQRSKDSDNDYD